MSATRVDAGYVTLVVLGRPVQMIPFETEKGITVREVLEQAEMEVEDLSGYNFQYNNVPTEDWGAEMPLHDRDQLLFTPRITGG
jgi:hypothetical protein